MSQKPSIRFDDIVAALPEATADLFTRTAHAADRVGQPIYLVGGPVRDLLLGRSLVDLDLMVEGDAKAVADAVVKASRGEALQTKAHPRFGTVRLEAEDTSIDLATLRHESYAHPGALPDVVPGTLDQDIARRDFSVNALVCRIDVAHPGKGSEVIDQCGGLEDLAKKRLRVLHDRSFHDDPTRAWRAARFAARLGMTLERRSRNVLRDALRDGAFGAVSGERIRRELTASFDEAHHGTHPGRVLRLLSDWHVLGALEPGLALGRDRMPPLRKLGRAVAQPEWAAPRWRPAIAGLSIWLAPMPAALRQRTLERFSIRGEQATRIVQFGRDADRTLKTLARARGRGAVDAALADRPEETIQALYALAETAVRRRILRWAAEDRRRRAPVSGSDLTAIGLAGPDIGRALARIRAGFLDGEVANREEAIALAEEIARRAQRKRPKRKSARGKPKTGAQPGHKKTPKKTEKSAPTAQAKPAKKKRKSSEARDQNVAPGSAIPDTSS